MASRVRADMQRKMAAKARRCRTKQSSMQKKLGDVSRHSILSVMSHTSTASGASGSSASSRSIRSSDMSHDALPIGAALLADDTHPTSNPYHKHKHTLQQRQRSGSPLPSTASAKLASNPFADENGQGTAPVPTKRRKTGERAALSQVQERRTSNGKGGKAACKFGDDTSAGKETRRTSLESNRESAFMASSAPLQRTVTENEGREQGDGASLDSTLDVSQEAGSNQDAKGEDACRNGSKKEGRGGELSPDYDYYAFLKTRKSTRTRCGPDGQHETAAERDGAETDDDDEGDDTWHEQENLADFQGTPVRGSKGAGPRMTREQRAYASALSRTASSRNRATSICMDAPVTSSSTDDDVICEEDAATQQQQQQQRHASFDLTASRHLGGSQPSLNHAAAGDGPCTASSVRVPEAAGASALHTVGRSSSEGDALDNVSVYKTPPRRSQARSRMSTSSRVASPPRAYVCSPDFKRTASVLVGCKTSDIRSELQRHKKIIMATERMWQYYPEADSIEPLQHRKVSQIAHAAITAQLERESAAGVDKEVTRSVTMNHLQLRLHWWATIEHREAKSYFIFATLSYKSQSFATPMVRVDGSSGDREVSFRDPITFDNVEPGFSIKGKVFCYTYTDPEKLQAQRRVSTPKKAMERATQAVRKLRDRTPRKLKQIKKKLTTKLSGGSRSESRGPATPDRSSAVSVARGHTESGTQPPITKDFTQVADFTVELDLLGDHHLDLCMLAAEEDHPIGSIAFVSSRISPVQTHDYEGFLTFKTESGWERFWTSLQSGVMSQYTQAKPRELLATTDLSTLPADTHVQRLSRQECARHFSFDLRASGALGEETVLLRIAGDSKEHQAEWRQALTNTLTRLQAWRFQ